MDYVDKLAALYCSEDDDGFTEAVAEIADAAFDEFRELIDAPGASVHQAAADTQPDGQTVPSWLYACAAVVVVEGLGDDDVQEEAHDILGAVCSLPRKHDYVPGRTLKP